MYKWLAQIHERKRTGLKQCCNKGEEKWPGYKHVKGNNRTSGWQSAQSFQ